MFRDPTRSNWHSTWKDALRLCCKHDSWAGYLPEVHDGLNASIVPTYIIYARADEPRLLTDERLIPTQCDKYNQNSLLMLFDIAAREPGRARCRHKVVNNHKKFRTLIGANTLFYQKSILHMVTHSLACSHSSKAWGTYTLVRLRRFRTESNSTRRTPDQFT